MRISTSYSCSSWLTSSPDQTSTAVKRSAVPPIERNAAKVMARHGIRVSALQYCRRIYICQEMFSKRMTDTCRVASSCMSESLRSRYGLLLDLSRVESGISRRVNRLPSTTSDSLLDIVTYSRSNSNQNLEAMDKQEFGWDLCLQFNPLVIFRDICRLTRVLQSRPKPMGRRVDRKRALRGGHRIQTGVYG